MRGSSISIIHWAVCLIFCLLVADSIMVGQEILSQNTSAVPREFQTNITVESNKIIPLELDFVNGDELELIFEMEVKENLPVDVWFVDSTNYVRLSDRNEFLYFIDGSGRDLKQAQKVVTITQHGQYDLVFANYNNVSVEVHLSYDITVYPEEEEVSSMINGEVVDKDGDPIVGAIVQLRDSNGNVAATCTTNSTGEFEFVNAPYGTYDLGVFADRYKDGRKTSVQITSVAFSSDVGSITLTENPDEETPLWTLPLIMLPLGLVLGVIIGFLVSRIIRSPGGNKSKMKDKPPAKKRKPKTTSSSRKKQAKNKDSAAPVKYAEKEAEMGEEEDEAEEETASTKKGEPEESKTLSARFCGHCGKPVETPFCPFCGKSAENP